MITINNPNSSLEIRIQTDDPILFDEMIREQSSRMVNYLRQVQNDGITLDARDAFVTAVETAMDIAKGRNCSKSDWESLVGYAGLLAAQAFGSGLLSVNGA